MVLMALFLQITRHLENFHGRNDSTLSGYKEQYLLYPIDKSQEKGFSYRAHWELPKIEYKGN
jgi:hypothetical protein